MLGGFLGAELTTLIREEAGAAYSVGARVVAAAGGAAHLGHLDGGRQPPLARRARHVARCPRRDGGGPSRRGQLEPGALGADASMGLRDLTSRDLALNLFRTMTLGFAPAVLGNEAAQIAATTRDDIPERSRPARATPCCR